MTVQRVEHFQKGGGGQVEIGDLGAFSPTKVYSKLIFLPCALCKSVCVGGGGGWVAGNCLNMSTQLFQQNLKKV